MKGQRISLFIAGKKYELEARTPAEEQNMRIAAQKINAQLDRYKTALNMSDFDKLSLVALTHTMEMLRLSKAKSVMETSTEGILNDLRSYLEKIDK